MSKQKNDNYNLLTEREKLIFLAGVFEGEGSFGFWSSGYKGKRYFGFTNLIALKTCSVSIGLL